MVELWKVYCLRVLDQYWLLWGSELTTENEQDLERTETTIVKLTLQEDLLSYIEG